MFHDIYIHKVYITLNINYDRLESKYVWNIIELFLPTDLISIQLIRNYLFFINIILLYL